MHTTEKIAALRALMQKHGLAAYIVPGTDPHASEYMAPHWMEMSWLTGFLGETGTAVVTMDKALLWTDSRYYLQAEAELAGSTVELMRESDIECPTIPEWLCAHIQGEVGVNPEMYSVNAYAALQAALEESHIGLVSVDLIRPLWTEGRPPIPCSTLYEYEEQYAGESVASKLQRTRNAMAQRHCQAMIVAALDEVAWLLNIRGKDVDYTPCLISYLVLETNACTLFVEPTKVDAAAAAYLQRIGVEVRGYGEVFDYLHRLQAEAVLFDGSKVNEALCEAINPTTKQVNTTPDPVLKMQSVKNAVELAGERIAMREDAVALTRFFRWLEVEALKTPQTEITLADKLHELRAKGLHFMDESFCTIAGWNANGAIVHYHAEPEACAKIEGNGVLLLDSGGQYLHGTTDITRTVWVGDENAIPADLKHDYTLVLKGHIALAQARFPKGTRGNQLDILAHQYMWAEGITYGHGTGHGVGHYMGCHEGPQNIRTDNNPNPLQVGNICSDEPGIYRANAYGIRIENLLAVREAGALSARTTGETYYEFETLTLCYYDTRLIERSLLTDSEIAWLNDYHRRVLAETAPRLTKDEAAWLEHKCKAL